MLIGLMAGIVSGLLGVGGGIVMTPALHYLYRLGWAEAVALSLFVIAVQAPIGVWRHARKGAVDWRTGTALALGGIGGVALGAWLLPRTPVAGLKVLFAGLMVLAAFRLRPMGLHRGWLLPMAFGAGVVSRLLGIGGGILTVPGLVFMGFGSHLAIGTSLVPVFTNATWATAGTLAGGLDWLPGLLLAAGAIPGTVAGAWAAHRLPEHDLRRVVSVALVMVAALVLVDGVRNLL